MRRNYTVIQALRGLAALWVVLFHAEEGGHLQTLVARLPGWLASGIFKSGHFGVAVFFGLSGFVIAHSLSDFRASARNLGQFLLKRSIRLDPAYWVSMVFVVLMGVLSARIKGEGPTFPNPEQVGAHLLYLQELLRLKEINSVYWTLTYEIQFYLFYALMKFVPRGLWPCLVLAILSAAGFFHNLPHGLFLELWGAFFVGALARHALDDRKWLAGLAVLSAILCTSMFGAMSAATALFLWFSVRRGWAEQGLNWRWLQFLGGVSYSLYLIHNPITGAVSFLVYRQLGTGLVPDIICLAMIVTASILGAACLWLLVERPSHRLSRRVRSPMPAGSELESRPSAITSRPTPPPAG